MLRWVVIGVGDITTRRVIPAILKSERSRFCGIVTCDPRKAAPYGARIFRNLEEALRDGAFDTVYAASPVYLHASQTVQSPRAGKHVLCEKPMAMNFDEAQAIVEAVRSNGRPQAGRFLVDFGE